MDSPPAKRTRLRQRSNPQQLDRVEQHLQHTEPDLDEQLRELRERNGFEHWTPDDNTNTNDTINSQDTRAAPIAPVPPPSANQDSPRTVQPSRTRQQHPPGYQYPHGQRLQQILPGQIPIRYIDGKPYVMIPADHNQQRVFLEQQRQIALARQRLHNPQAQQLQEQQRALGAQFAANAAQRPQALAQQAALDEQQRQVLLARQWQLGEQFARNLPYGAGPGGGDGPASSPQAGQMGHAPPQALPTPAYPGQSVPHAPFATQAQQTPLNAQFHPALHQRTHPQSPQAPQAPPVQRPIRTPSLSNIWRPDYSWIQKQLGEGEPPPQRVGMEEMKKSCRTYAGVNLDSKAETEVPEFWFPPAQLPAGDVRNGSKSNSASFSPEPISLLHTSDVVTFCVLFKKYLLDVFGLSTFYEEGIVRMETLNLEKLDGKTEGYIIWADDACQIGMPGEPTKTKNNLNLHGKKWRAVTIVAILIPQKGRPRSKFAWEKDARFFYAADTISLGPVLSMLDNAAVKLIDAFDPGTPKYRQLSTWLEQSFLKAVIPPDSQDYKHAMIFTDCCPDILEPDSALERLETNRWLHFSLTAEPGKDLEDDRYLHLLHPVEREAASLANLKCAEYLFIKRGFFKAFYEEIYRTDKKIDPDASSSAVSGRGVSTTGQPASRIQAEDKNETPLREDTPMATSDAPALTSGRRRRGRPSRRAQEAAASLAQTESNLTSTSSPLTSLAATPEPPSGRAASRAASTAPNLRSRVEASARRKVRVRTHNAHRNWLRNEYGFSWSQAERLIICWEAFGFLEEGRFLDWLRAGGIFEVEEDEEDAEEDEADERAGMDEIVDAPDGADQAERKKDDEMVEGEDEDAEFELDE